jgi:hypothetical protein
MTTSHAGSDLTVLRDFLYLDQPMVQGFLAQLEGGLFDESTERQRTAGKGGVSGGLKAGPLQGGAEKGRETSHETEAVVKQVAASEFQRLYDHLVEEDLVVLEEVDDGTVLDQLTRKQIIEVDARVVVSGTHQMLDLLGQISAIAPILGQDFSLGGEEAQVMAVMQAFNAVDGPLNVIATVLGDAGVAVALELDRSYVRTEGWDVEATALIRVQRRIKPGERHLVGDLMGPLTKMLPDSEKDSILDSLQTEDAAQIIGPSEITAPGLIGIPIAIYR